MSDVGDDLSWSEHGANSARTVGLVVMGWVVMDLRFGLDDLCGSFRLRIFCDCVNKLRG